MSLSYYYYYCRTNHIAVVVVCSNICLMFHDTTDYFRPSSHNSRQKKSKPRSPGRSRTCSGHQAHWGSSYYLSSPTTKVCARPINCRQTYTWWRYYTMRNNLVLESKNSPWLAISGLLASSRRTLENVVMVETWKPWLTISGFILASSGRNLENVLMVEIWKTLEFRMGHFTLCMSLSASGAVLTRGVFRTDLHFCSYLPVQYFFSNLLHPNVPTNANELQLVCDQMRFKKSIVMPERARCDCDFKSVLVQAV